MQFIDLKSQYDHLKTKINARIQTVLDHGIYIMGPEVKELEERLADYVGVRHVVSCANGTDALTLALMALGLKEGDAVFCPTFTFFATGESIALSGATPVFVDSNVDTFNICPIHLEKQIIKCINQGIYKPKAIMTVDLFGLPANYPEIRVIAKKYNLQIIEDGAQGFGGEISGQRACSFGDISTTSFFPAKPLGCYGDGGAVFTNDDNLAELLRSYRVHGKGEDKYDNIRIGINSRLDTIQAAILLEKLAEFPTELKARNHSADIYNQQLSMKYKTPSIPFGYKSSWAQYTLIVKDRQSVIDQFKDTGVPTMIYYQKCLHNQTAFSYLSHNDEDFPNATKLADTVLSLPMHPYLKT